MHFQRSFAVVMTVGIASSLASAQDYGDTRGTADEYFKPTAEVSVNISGFAGGSWHTLTTEPGAVVARSTFDDPMFVDVGEVAVDSGTLDTVEAAWWHQEIGDADYVRLVLRTQGGSEFVPFGSKTSGSTIQAYSYELGGNGDGLDFRNWVTDVNWEELSISYSYDGGQTVFSDPAIDQPIGDANWGGTDDLHLGLAFPGDGVNWMQISYKFTAVPAPTSLAALLGAGLVATRRRRA